MELRVGPANSGTYTPSGASKQIQGIPAVPEVLGLPGKARKGIGDLKVSVENSKTQVIGRDHFETVDGDKDTHVQQNYTVKARKKIRIEAGDQIELVCGKSRIKLSENGTIEVNGQKILQLGDKLVSVQSDKIKLN
jgi:type VI secretion system secreted protein VgrG